MDNGYRWDGVDDDKTVTRDLLVMVSFSNEVSGRTVKITNAAYIDCEASMQTVENIYG